MWLTHWLLASIGTHMAKTDPLISRRNALLGGAVAAGTWVAPSVIGLDRVEAATPSAGYTLLYSEDFEGAIGVPGVASWNFVNTEQPIPSRTILGRFGNDNVVLKMALPPHECVQICFDLYVNDSWDGTGATWGGPDRFGFAVDGTTIWNEPYTTTNAPAGGTIIEGPAQLWFSTGQWWIDRVIRYCVEVPHTNSTVNFSFFGSGLQSIPDESWGLDNVEVSTG